MGPGASDAPRPPRGASVAPAVQTPPVPSDRNALLDSRGNPWASGSLLLWRLPGGESRHTRVLWRKSVGEGFAGPAIAGGHLVLHHRIGREEIVDAIDPKTGAAQWRYSYSTGYRDDFGFDEGPRAVPVIANGRVYTFGAEGELSALDLATGKRLWNTNVMRQFDVRKGFFGAAGSPLVEDGRVIANLGGKLQSDAWHRRGLVGIASRELSVAWVK